MSLLANAALAPQIVNVIARRLTLKKGVDCMKDLFEMFK
jgi:hypothetical protein